MSTEYFCQRQQIVRSITLTPFGCSGNYLGSPSSSSSHEMSVKQSVSWLFMASSSTAQPSLLSRPERPRNEDSFTTCPQKQLLWALCNASFCARQKSFHLSPPGKQPLFCAISTATSGHWASPAQHHLTTTLVTSGRAQLCVCIST